MDVSGNITRISAGGAYGRSSSVGPVAPSVRGDNDGTSEQKAGDRTAQAARRPNAASAAIATAAKAKAKERPEEREPSPEVVTIDPMFDRRVGASRSGIYIDLVYRNTNFRAARLVGSNSQGEGESAVDDAAASGISAGDAARAYGAATGRGGSSSGTVLTG